MSTGSRCGSAISKCSPRHPADGRTSSKRSWGPSIARRNKGIRRSKVAARPRGPLGDIHELELVQPAVVLVRVDVVVDPAGRQVEPAPSAVRPGGERDVRGRLDPEARDIDLLDEAAIQCGLEDERLATADDEQ